MPRPHGQGDAEQLPRAVAGGMQWIALGIGHEGQAGDRGHVEHSSAPPIDQADLASQLLSVARQRAGSLE